jgi:hypothetical protein
MANWSNAQPISKNFECDTRKSGTSGYSALVQKHLNLINVGSIGSHSKDIRTETSMQWTELLRVMAILSDQISKQIHIGSFEDMDELSEMLRPKIWAVSCHEPLQHL